MIAQKGSLLLAMLSLIAMATICIATATGSVALSWPDVLAALKQVLQSDPATLESTLVVLRLERAIAAFVTGASLALAGVLMQALLRNPLADPYILGLSSGAAVGALGSMLIASALWSTEMGALTGAGVVSLLLYLLVFRPRPAGIAQRDGTTVMLLTGVILSCGCMALVTLILSLAPEGTLRSMVFWMIGDLSASQPTWSSTLVLAAALAVTLRMARSINVAALQGATAAALGIHFGNLRRGLFFCCAILTAIAVSQAGSIGFVGLIVPHSCRFAFGADHRLLLPAATLAGGAFLVLADTLARTITAPVQLPVGVITALIGVPIFLLQLTRAQQS